MTTIAYSAKDDTLASDSMCSDEGYLQQTNCTKVFEIDGDLIGTARGAYAGLVFLEWYKGNLPDDCMDMKLSPEDDFECMVIDREGVITLWNRYLIPDVKGKLPYYAIGCGSKCAMVALDCGKNAIQAVEMACAHDLYSGGKIQHIKRKPLRKK